MGSAEIVERYTPEGGMMDKIYCVRCDRAVRKDKVCDEECEEKAKEVEDFLKAYERIWGDTSPLEILTEITKED